MLQRPPVLSVVDRTYVFSERPMLDWLKFALYRSRICYRHKELEHASGIHTCPHVLRVWVNSIWPLAGQLDEFIEPGLMDRHDNSC
jgi:hypothetical protein